MFLSTVHPARYSQQRVLHSLRTLLRRGCPSSHMYSLAYWHQDLESGGHPETGAGHGWWNLWLGSMVFLLVTGVDGEAVVVLVVVVVLVTLGWGLNSEVVVEVSLGNGVTTVVIVVVAPSRYLQHVVWHSSSIQSKKRQSSSWNTQQFEPASGLHPVKNS